MLKSETITIRVCDYCGIMLNHDKGKCAICDKDICARCGVTFDNQGVMYTVCKDHVLELFT